MVASWSFDSADLASVIEALDRSPSRFDETCLLPEREPVRIELSADVVALSFEEAAHLALVATLPELFRLSLPGAPSSVYVTDDEAYSEWRVVLVGLGVPADAAPDLPGIRMGSLDAGALAKAVIVDDARRGQIATLARECIRSQSKTVQHTERLGELSLADARTIGSSGRSSWVLDSRRLSELALD